MMVLAPALNVLKELASYYPALVPIIIVFYVESCTSLLAWRAVQRIPLPEFDSDERKEEGGDLGAQKPRNYRVLRLIVWASMAMFLVALAGGPELFENVSQAMQLRIFYLCVLFIPTMLLVPDTMFVIVGVYGSAILRNREGEISTIKHKDKDLGRARLPISIFLALSSAILALWFELTPAIIIVYMGIMRIFANPSFKNRKTAFAPRVWSVMIMALQEVILITLFVVYKPATPFVFGLHAEGKSSAIQWRSIWWSALSSWVPLHILSILLRFDHANSLPSDYVEPVCKSTVGVRFAYWKLRAFPRPYFAMASIVLCGSFIGIAVLSVEGFLKCTFETFGLFVMWIASPVMIIVSLLQAVLKGQLKKLWNYEEDWTAIPTVNQEEPDDVDASKEQKDGLGDEGFETKLSFDVDKEPVLQDDAV